MPLFGPPDVEGMKSKGDVNGLIDAIGYQKDNSVRRNAIKALGELGDTRAVEPLIASLTDSLVRRDAVIALGKIGGSRIVEPLISVLQDQDNSYFTHLDAIQALVNTKDPRCIEPLAVSWRSDKITEVQDAAFKALVSFGPPVVDRLLPFLFLSRVADALAKIGGEHVIQELTAILRDEKSKMRQAAAQVLGKIGNPGLVVVLVTALNDKDAPVRRTAAMALGEIGDSGPVEALVPALNDEDASVREAAAQALDRLGWKPDQSDAAYFIARQDWDKCISLGTSAVAGLITELKEKRGGREVIKALGKIGDNRAIEPLVIALRDENWEMCKSAADALDKFGWNPDDSTDGAWYWLAKNNWDKCVSAGSVAVEPLVFALQKRHFNAGRSHLTEHELKFENGDWRAYVAKTLGKIGDIHAVMPLIDALKLVDPNGHSAEEAAEALGNIGDPRAIEPLTALFLGDIGDPGYLLPRTAAAKALGKIGHAGEVGPLITMLKSPHRGIRIAAAQALLALCQGGRLDEACMQVVAKQQARDDWPL